MSSTSKWNRKCITNLLDLHWPGNSFNTMPCTIGNGIVLERKVKYRGAIRVLTRQRVKRSSWVIGLIDLFQITQENLISLLCYINNKGFVLQNDVVERNRTKWICKNIQPLQSSFWSQHLPGPSMMPVVWSCDVFDIKSHDTSCTAGQRQRSKFT